MDFALLDVLKREFGELKQARTSAIVIGLASLMFGLFLRGIWDSRQIELLQARVDALQSQATAAIVTDAAWHLAPRTTITLIAGIVICLGLGAVLFWTPRKKDKPAIPKITAPTLTLFAHDAAIAANPDVYERIKGLFRDAGWVITLGRTNLPKHASGVWLHGGTDVERRIATWALETVGVVPTVDYANDNPPALQVIVGYAVEGQGLTQPNESLRFALKEAQKDMRDLRSDMQEHIDGLKQDRDGFEQAWLTTKRAFGIYRLVQFANRVRENVETGHLKPVTVTIRFVGYATADIELIKMIESILQQHTDWKIERDGSNNPALMPIEGFKVIFESGGAFGTFGEVGTAFQEGRLLGDVPIGFHNHLNRFDDQGHLVIVVLPTATAS